MKKTIFFIVVLLLSANYIFSQNLSFIVYNTITNQPIRDAEILLSTHNMKHFLAIKTDDYGKAQIENIKNFCSEDTIIFRISKRSYYTKFQYHICSKVSKVRNYNLDILPQKMHPYGYGFEEFKFIEGTVELDSFSDFRVRRFFPICQDEMQFQVLMQIYYNEKENNGFDLSFKRANKIIQHILDNGWTGDEFFLKVEQSDFSHLNFEIIGNYVPKY